MKNSGWHSPQEESDKSSQLMQSGMDEQFIDVQKLLRKEFFKDRFVPSYGFLLMDSHESKSLEEEVLIGS
jgi:hypothetical protein